MLEGRGQVQRERRLAERVGVPGVEGAEPGGALVGPVASGLTGREAEAVGQQHGVVGHVLRGVQVLREQRRGDVRQRLGGVREALAGGPVGGELAGRPQVDAGRVADGGVVLGVARPPQRDEDRRAAPRAADSRAAGSVTFDGVDVATLSGDRLRAMRRRMQMIFQDPYSSLDPRMTAGLFA